jgi:ribonuclease D
MQDKFVEVMPRAFNPMSAPGLSNKAREAVNAAFEAMSSWRDEVAKSNETNSKKVIEKMAGAAAAQGWPEQIVDAARAQMQGLAEMQVKTMDHMMDAWEEQLKLPNPMGASPSGMLSKLKSLPNFGSSGSWPGANAFRISATNPMQFWAQVAQQWQKSWTDAMTFWSSGGKPH